MSAPQLSPSEQEAVRWWVARQSGAWTAADDRAFADWLVADEAHRQAHEKVARAWEAAGGLARPVAGRRGTARRTRPATVAAALVLAVAAGWLADRWWQGAAETVATRPGETRTLALADGSRVVLAGGGELRVRVGRGSRSAVLERGEALFEVAHDSDRPFQVKAGAGRITDLGTRFDVDLRQDRVRVAVLEGRVALDTAAGRLELAAGKGGGYDAGGALLPPFTTDEAAVAWQAGRLLCRDEPLAEVLERLGRFHDVRFELTDPSLARLRISGLIQADDLDLFLSTLAAGFPVRSARPGPDRVVLTPAPSRR